MSLLALEDGRFRWPCLDLLCRVEVGVGDHSYRSICSEAYLRGGKIYARKLYLCELTMDKGVMLTK